MLVTLASAAGTGTVLAAAGSIVGVGVVCAILRRRPDAFPVLAIAALPFRLPISAEGRTVNLLIPLYVVVAAGTLVLLLPRIVQRREAPPRGLEWLLAATVALYALQAAYSSDAAKAAENLAFFYVPFALLLVLLATCAGRASCSWRASPWRRCWRSPSPAWASWSTTARPSS